MKSFAAALLFCFVVLMLGSCSKDNPVDSSPGVNQIWPLKSGNTWAVRSVNYDTTGTVTGSGSGVLAVTMDTVVAGETWYRISGAEPMFFANKSDGFWAMSVSASGPFAGLLFKYPVHAGDTWNDLGDQMVLQSADTVITVPAGTYHCYLYRILYNSAPSDDYYLRPGTGIIAEDSYSRTSSGRPYIVNRLSLTSVTLK